MNLADKVSIVAREAKDFGVRTANAVIFFYLQNRSL